MITGWKWKAEIAVENAESALRMKEVIGIVANGKAGLGLHPKRWWSKESMAHRRKMISEEIHHLEEQGAWTKWENAKDCCHMERPQAHGTKEIKFPHKSSLQRLTFMLRG